MLYLGTLLCHLGDPLDKALSYILVFLLVAWCLSPSLALTGRLILSNQWETTLILIKAVQTLYVCMQRYYIYCFFLD